MKKEPATPLTNVLNIQTPSSNSSQASDQEFEQLETQFQDLEVKRLYHPDPTSSAKNWYHRPSPPDLRFEERNVGNQFSISSGRLYEWNIDGLSEQEILNKIQHMTMVANNYLDDYIFGNGIATIAKILFFFFFFFFYIFGNAIATINLSQIF